MGNGWTVIDMRRIDHLVTIYLRIPRELSRPVDGGCSCDYCKAHPTEIPHWDTLAVCDVWGDHSWTVHYPQARPITPAEREYRSGQEQRRRDRG